MTATPSAATVNTNLIPPLESGDRLTRPEFERRYAAALVQKAELIEGVVYVASPLRWQQHAEPHSRIHGWAWTYQIATPGVCLGIEPTVRLDLDNEPQPDIVLRLDETVGGQSSLTADGYVQGAPELVIEIAASSAAIDLGDKKQAYRRNGVGEYGVWQVYENRFDWFHLVAGEYQPLLPDPTGVIQSRIFPGLWLAVEALLKSEMTQVLTTLQAGLNSSEHQQFIQRLADRATSTAKE